MPFFLLDTQVIWWLGLFVKFISIATADTDVACPKAETKHFHTWPTWKRRLVVGSDGWIPLHRQLDMCVDVTLVGAPLHSWHAEQ